MPEVPGRNGVRVSPQPHFGVLRFDLCSRKDRIRRVKLVVPRERLVSIGVVLKFSVALLYLRFEGNVALACDKRVGVL